MINPKNSAPTLDSSLPSWCTSSPPHQPGVHGGVAGSYWWFMNKHCPRGQTGGQSLNSRLLGTGFQGVARPLTPPRHRQGGGGGAAVISRWGERCRVQNVGEDVWMCCPRCLPAYVQHIFWMSGSRRRRRAFGCRLFFLYIPYPTHIGIRSRQTLRQHF